MARLHKKTLDVRERRAEPPDRPPRSGAPEPLRGDPFGVPGRYSPEKTNPPKALRERRVPSLACPEPPDRPLYSPEKTNLPARVHSTPPKALRERRVPSLACPEPPDRPLYSPGKTNLPERVREPKNAPPSPNAEVFFYRKIT